MNKVPEFVDVAQASSAPEAVARWWGFLILTKYNDSATDSASEALRGRLLKARRVDPQAVERFVGVLTHMVDIDYSSALPDEDGNQTAGLATDDNNEPNVALFIATATADIKPDWLTFPANSMTLIQNGVAYAALGSGALPIQIWPPTQD
jgi:hypothetical protein